MNRLSAARPHFIAPTAAPPPGAGLLGAGLPPALVALYETALAERAALGHLLTNLQAEFASTILPELTAARALDDNPVPTHFAVAPQQTPHHW